MISISKLKSLLSDECKRVDAGEEKPHFEMIYYEEYLFLKKHKNMNIAAYQQEYAKILSETFEIPTPYNKLSDEQKQSVIKGFEHSFGITTEELKLKNTVIGFKCPYARLWLHLTKK